MRDHRRGPVALFATLIAVGGLAVVEAPSPVEATGNTLRLSPATISVAAVGQTFSVAVIGNANVPVSGTSASVAFDRTREQIQSISKGVDWVANGAGFAGYPSPANMSAFLSAANASGLIPALAPFFSDGSSELGPGDHEVFTVAFVSTACGTSNINLPIGPADGNMIDGSADTYGNALVVSSSGGSVTLPCAPGAPGGGTIPPGSMPQAPVGGPCPISVAVDAAGSAYTVFSQEGTGFGNLWGSTTLDLNPKVLNDTIALQALHAGSIQVAGIDRPLSPGDPTDLYAWKIGDDGASPLFVVIRKFSVANRTDNSANSALIRGDDFVNFMLSGGGQAAFGGLTGFEGVPVPAVSPIPDFDLTLDGAIGLGDLGNITGKWGKTSTCRGWVRADVNNDGSVGLADIGRVTARWGGTGFVPTPAYNGGNAAAWADLHALSCPSTPLIPCDQEDCTNFVSYALFMGGGLPQSLGNGDTSSNGNWFSSKDGLGGWVQSDTWAYTSGAPSGSGASLWTYLLSSGDTSLGSASGISAATSDGLSPGDVLFYDWLSDGSLDHSAMQTTNAFGLGQPGNLVDEHTVGTDGRAGVWWTLQAYNQYAERTTIWLVHVDPAS